MKTPEQIARRREYMRQFMAKYRKTAAGKAVTKASKANAKVRACRPTPAAVAAVWAWYDSHSDGSWATPPARVALAIADSTRYVPLG